VALIFLPSRVRYLQLRAVICYLFSLLFMVFCGDLSATEFHNDFLSLFFVILGFVGRSVSGGVS
jgi:positive regulator of sigma E activity